MFTPILDHTAKAIKRLLSQYKKTNVEDVVFSIVAPLQTLEQVFADMNAENLANSFGAQLDGYGEIVGVERLPSEADADYLVRIRAQIGINLSQGQPERVIEVFRLLTGVPRVFFHELYPGEIGIAAQVTFANQDEVDSILRIIESVAPAGVRVAYIVVTVDENDSFAFAGSLPGLGFSSTADPLLGGKFAGLRVRNGEFAFAGQDSKGEGFGSVYDPLLGGQFVS